MPGDFVYTFKYIFYEKQCSSDGGKCEEQKIYTDRRGGACLVHTTQTRHRRVVVVRIEMTIHSSGYRYKQKNGSVSVRIHRCRCFAEYFMKLFTKAIK